MSKVKIQNRPGFTAIETIVSIVILAIVGLLIGQTFLQTGRSAARSVGSQKATVLGEMVLEQYAAYAAQDYANLASYDKDQTSAQAFFGTKDNLGYDQMKITTRAEAMDRGGSLVTVKIFWGGGADAQSLSFTKTFAESNANRQTTALSGI